MIYTIDGTNHIIGHMSAEDAAVVTDAEQFTSEAELGELAAEWPAARLVEIWMPRCDLLVRSSSVGFRD